MPPKPFLDISEIDIEKVVADREVIRKTVPQRHEMEQIEVIHHVDHEQQIAVGSLGIQADDWWAKGHIPGRPIFPGALMIEAAAQLSTWLFKEITKDERFFGFGGVDDVKFRGAVVPPTRLVLLAKLVQARSRVALFDTQGLVDGRMVFSARITGLAV